MGPIEMTFGALTLILIFSTGILADDIGSLVALIAAFACICAMFTAEAKRDKV